jgi:type I restriction enzyme R subunit
MKHYTEQQTRKNIIDKKLYDVGWNIKYIKSEVNSVKSNFKNKNYICDYNPKTSKGDRFIDYLLLAEDNSPLAIVEAKRFSADPKKGKIQARTYQEDIEKDTGIKIPIFLTNGNTWILIDQDGVQRNVWKPFSQETLTRRLDLYKNRDPDLRLTRLNSRIVDRTKSIEVISKLQDYFNEKNRAALILMATGTGKTRVAMGLIDVLINANYARNVLFIADRITLAQQAKETGFSKFFTEPVSNIREEGFDTSKRLYVSTIQTLMSKNKVSGEFFFEQFDPGFFDLIVFDEAHRSIYDKNDMLAQYFDSLRIGLTATPKDSERQNTFELFGCYNGEPTVEYSYDEAVRDKVLVTYSAQVIETDVLSSGISGEKLSDKLKDELRRQEEGEPDKVKFSGKEFAKYFMDDKTNDLIVDEFMSRCYKSDDNKPCKTIFFCASKVHANCVKDAFSRKYPSLGNDVMVITSDEYRAGDEIKRFKQNDSPRIALSVGMLDTGVDVPEVMNLVFVKPVYSPQRFWQMVGRGTRSESAVEYFDRLPDGHKKDFLILDFAVGGHSNVEYHNLIRSSKDSAEGLMKQMFDRRVKLLSEHMDSEQRDVLAKRFYEDIEALGEETFKLQEKLDLIRELKGKEVIYANHINELEDDISPLMMLRTMGDSRVASFISDCERLFGYVLNKDFDKVEGVKDKFLCFFDVLLTKTNLSEIKKNEKLLKSLFDESFWDSLTFRKIEQLIDNVAPLMEYYEKPKTKMYKINREDTVMEVREYEKEVEADETLSDFLLNNLIGKKLVSGEGITTDELNELEGEMRKLDYNFTVENIQKSQGKDFVKFLFEACRKSYDKDPKVEMENAFDKFILDNSHYNSRQIEFLRLLKKVFIERKNIKLEDFGKEPFSDDVGCFNFAELNDVVSKIGELKWGIE